MNRRAFTLIEFLAVASIIALLIALLLPALTQARESAKNVICLSNLKHITPEHACLRRGQRPVASTRFRLAG